MTAEELQVVAAVASRRREIGDATENHHKTHAGMFTKTVLITILPDGKQSLKGLAPIGGMKTIVTILYHTDSLICKPMVQSLPSALLETKWSVPSDAQVVR